MSLCQSQSVTSCRQHQGTTVYTSCSASLSQEIFKSCRAFRSRVAYTLVFYYLCLIRRRTMRKSLCNFCLNYQSACSTNKPYYVWALKCGFFFWALSHLHKFSENLTKTHIKEQNRVQKIVEICWMWDLKRKDSSISLASTLYCKIIGKCMYYFSVCINFTCTHVSCTWAQWYIIATNQNTPSVTWLQPLVLDCLLLSSGG